MKLLGGLISMNGISFFMLSILAVAVIGYLLGRIKIKGVALGDAAVFIAALLYGALFYKYLDAQLTVNAASGISYASNALKFLENIGLVLFVTSIGFIAGPKFFGNIKKNFKSYVIVGIVLPLAGGLTAIGCILFDRYIMNTPPESYEELTAMIVGLLSGAQTSTPAFTAAKATVDPIYESAVTVGHGIAYIFGVIGIVLFVQIVPKILKSDMASEREKLAESNLSRKNGGEKIAEKNKERKLLNFDGHGFMPFCLAAALGVFIGSIKIPLSANGFGGTCFSLTTTGGCLLMALIFGHFGRIGSVNIMPGEATLKIFKEFGLILFLIGAGIAGGADFAQYFKISYFLYGVVMTVIPLFAGFFFCKYVLKMQLLNNLGSLTGGRTSTPALGTLISVSKTDDVAAPYAATYPIALIFVVLISQFLIILF